MKKPVFYIFAGLPGTGKTTLSKGLCQSVNAVYLRIDTIEQALRDLCLVDVQEEGYRMAYRIAEENLRIGKDVIADSCNPINITRVEWLDVAFASKAIYINIVVVCSDRLEHRRRVETRQATVPGLALPTWDEVKNREYDPWLSKRIIIDTAGQTQDQSLAGLLNRLDAYKVDHTRI